MTEIYLEILDDPEATAAATSSETTTLEISVQQDLSGVTVPVQEFLEIVEQGPTGPPDASGLAFIRWNGSWAARNTVTTDPLRPVVWIGPSAPPVDSTYALDNVDVWWNTSV